MLREVRGEVGEWNVEMAEEHVEVSVHVSWMASASKTRMTLPLLTGSPFVAQGPFTRLGRIAECGEEDHQ